MAGRDGRLVGAVSRLLAVVVAGLVVVGAASCTARETAPRGEREPVDPQAVAEAVDGFVEGSTALGIENLRAILVSVDGETLVERYPGSGPEETAAVASVTKSVVSTLLGIAEGEGLLSRDQTLRELLPAYAGAMSPAMAAITLRELLTMSAGLAGDVRTGGPSPGGRDWVASILGRGVDHPPGTAFAYSNAGSHLLAAILVEATGRSVLAYARARLFDPLGIQSRPAFQPRLRPGAPEPERGYRRAGFAWLRDPQGIHLGLGSLKLSAPDLLKIGTLFLDEGVWEGRRLVPADWVRDATAPEVETGQSVPQYGYQWWVATVGDHRAFAALGVGGQIVEVVPDLGLVVVASTWIDETVDFDSTTWMLMVDIAIVPALEPTGS